MKILNEVLNELKYEAKEQFAFKNGDSEFIAFPFVSKQFPSQVFILVNLDYAKLNLIRNTDFMPNLANEFCNQTYHAGEMDKNISLIIKSICNEEELNDTSEKIKIEDDPYYFKKYVFTCTEQTENKAIEYFENRKNAEKENFSFVKEIQNYLLITEVFDSYKNDAEAEEVYSYIVELATKLPIIPLKVNSVNQIKTVNDYFNEFLDNNELTLNIEAIEKFILSNIKFDEDKVAKIIAEWEKV